MKGSRKGQMATDTYKHSWEAQVLGLGGNPTTLSGCPEPQSELGWRKHERDHRGGILLLSREAGHPRLAWETKVIVSK